MTKVRDYLRQYLGYYAVGVVSVLYILTAIFILDRSGKTIARIIGDGCIAFFLGLFITRIFDLQGLMTGEQDERFIATNGQHAEIVIRITPYFSQLDDWCEEMNTKNYYIQRSKILARAGLKYKDCFDEDGIAKTYDFTIPKHTPIWVKGHKIANYHRKIEIRKLKGYTKAVQLKLTPISSGVLTSEGGKQDDIYNLGRTKREYERQTATSDVISKIGAACIFGYYGVKLISDFSVINLIWTALQVGLFILMGIIKMYQSNMFITGEFRGRIIKKIDNLLKFENYIKGVNDGKEIRLADERG